MTASLEFLIFRGTLVKIEKDIALLDWMHREIDLIEADCLPDA